MRTRCIIAAIIFSVLTLMKLTIPGGAEFLRRECERYVARDTDYSSVMALFSQTETTEDTFHMQRELRRVPMEQKQKPTYNFKTLAQVHEQQLSTVKAPADDALTKKVSGAFFVESTAEDNAKIVPEAVQVFLDSQADYADYSLPANVSYEMPELPFDHSAPVIGYNSSGFGYRFHPVYNEVRFHYGTDVAAYTGEPIYAFADGTVTTAAYSNSYGNYIVITHIDGWQSLYAHCSSLLVESGTYVSCGDQIALVGATGVVTGPHLHFELTCDGVYTNPEYYVNYT